MKNKILLISVLAISLIVSSNACAVSQNSAAAGQSGQQVQQQTQTANQGESTQVQAQNTSNSATSTGSKEQQSTQIKTQEQTQQQTQQQTQSETQSAKKLQINAQEHKSAVSDFVQKLLQVAERQTNIGQQVKEIAQQQSQSADATTQAVEKIQTRNKIKTFLFGSDYKNLGSLRSEMVQTRNRLEQLNQLKENVQNQGDETELQNQIQTLEQEQAKIESFIKDNESKFSLFGWMVKLFSK